MGYAIDLWKIVLNSNCSEETRINIKIGLDELNAKAKAFDEILKIDLDQHEIMVHGQVEDIVNKYRRKNK